jgi:VanZ family protein
MALIFYFSSLEDTELSGGFLSDILTFFYNKCSSVPYISLFIDKVFHAGIYAVLGLLYYFSLRESGIYRHLLLFSVVLAAGYGITDEFHQSFVPGRVASAGDVLADVIGAMFGALAAGMLISIRQRKVK